VKGLILLGLGYVLPSDEPPALENSNKRFEELFGYPAYAYHKFFLSDEAPALLRANIDRFYYAMHGAPRHWMKEIWCCRGQMKNWLLNQNCKVDLCDYAQDPALRTAFFERFQRDGFVAPLCYYKAMHSNVQYDTTKNLAKGRFVVQVPACHIVCIHDPICRRELSTPAKDGGFLPDLEEFTVDIGHWVPLENPVGAAELMISFLQRRFPTSPVSAELP
jgi:soluble epoxide hydrolase / lipid-phosphate phosphatase